MGRKRLCLGIVLVLLTFWSSCEAAGNMWMDEHAEIQAKDYKKVIVMPLRVSSEKVGVPDRLGNYDKILLKRLGKRFKQTNFLGFGRELPEKQQILRARPEFAALAGEFPSEMERAKAVHRITGADGYLVPHVRYARQRQDVSPETVVTVQHESYYNVRNGPHGDKYRLGLQKWQEAYVIPQHTSSLQMLDMDFVLYDAHSGQKALTLIDYHREYGVSEADAYGTVVKNFAGDWWRQKKDKPQTVAAEAPVLGFEEVQLPAAVRNDLFSRLTVDYAIKDEAGDRLQNWRVDERPGAGRYYVAAAVIAYERGETWHPPYASVSPVHQRTEEFYWYDEDGYEHKGKREYYRTAVTPHFGYNSFWYKAGLDLQLRERQSGAVLAHYRAVNTDGERFANALREILREFYRQVDKCVTHPQRNP